MKIFSRFILQDGFWSLVFVTGLSILFVAGQASASAKADIETLEDVEDALNECIDAIHDLENLLKGSITSSAMTPKTQPTTTTTEKAQPTTTTTKKAQPTTTTTESAWPGPLGKTPIFSLESQTSWESDVQLTLVSINNTLDQINANPYEIEYVATLEIDTANLTRLVEESHYDDVQASNVPLLLANSEEVLNNSQRTKDKVDNELQEVGRKWRITVSLISIAVVLFVVFIAIVSCIWFKKQKLQFSDTTLKSRESDWDAIESPKEPKESMGTTNPGYMTFEDRFRPKIPRASSKGMEYRPPSVSQRTIATHQTTST